MRQRICVYMLDRWIDRQIEREREREERERERERWCWRISEH